MQLPVHYAMLLVDQAAVEAITCLMLQLHRKIIALAKIIITSLHHHRETRTSVDSWEVFNVRRCWHNGLPNMASYRIFIGPNAWCVAWV